MRCALLFVAGCGFQGAALAGDAAPVQVDDGSPAQMPDARTIVIDGPTALPDAAPTSTWACGPMPADPADPMSFGDATTSLKVSDMSFAGGLTATAAPGAQPAISFGWFIHDAACPDCRDQIEYGWVDTSGVGKRRDCLFDGFMALPSQTRSGTINATITVPSTPGQYTLRVALTEENSCNSHSDWADGSPPPASHTIAIVCVH